MFEGNKFLPETGMPILKIERRRVLLAVELPEPFFVPTVIEKSFTIVFIELLLFYVVASLREAISLQVGIAHLHSLALPARANVRAVQVSGCRPRNDMKLIMDDEIRDRYV